VKLSRPFSMKKPCQVFCKSWMKPRKGAFLLAVGSSSEQDWVHGHLKRLGIFDRFDTIVTADDVKNAKPEPDIYLKVLANLDVAPQNALVLEDSNNGVVASHRAGIRVIAVPNEVHSRSGFLASHRHHSQPRSPQPGRLFP